MANYSRITDPRLETKAVTRYASEIASLELIGFRHLANCLETLGPFSAVFQLPVLLLMLAKREVLAFSHPLRLAVANVLMFHSEPPTIALCMGMGIKLYTGFKDDTHLISSTFLSRPYPGPGSPITKSPPSPTVDLAWSAHKTRIQEMVSEGKVVQEGPSFEHYVAMSLREEELSKYA